MNLFAQRKLSSIKSKNEIKDLLENGKKVYTKVGIFFLKKTDEPVKNIAVLVKKSVGKAVKRNYYKRLIREYIRKNIENFSDYNKIIFVINKSIEFPFTALKKELDQKLKAQ